MRSWLTSAGRGADLSSARLGGNALKGANLSGVDLSGVDLSGANLKGVIFEPSVNPAPAGIAFARDLGYLSWAENSVPIFTLRKSLLEGGFGDAVRQVTAAIRRKHQNLLERWFFDWTCEWGANWVRPLSFAGALSLIFAVIYWAGMHIRKGSGLYLATTGQRIPTAAGRQRVLRINPVPQMATVRCAQIPDLDLDLELRAQVKQLSFRQTLRREFRAFGTAFLFSTSSTFNIGFREFNVGVWIRMIQPREFDIRARGWMRTLSGIQSLVGIGLVALSLLSYFGHPFD
jgi:hypothetical protein